MAEIFGGLLEVMVSLVELCYLCAILFSFAGIPAALIGVLVHHIKKKNGTLKWQIEQRQQNQLPPPSLDMRSDQIQAEQIQPYVFKSSAERKGERGELHLYYLLQKVNGYKKILHNLYLPTDNGQTTEIDLILIHESGFYVIESKNYSGWIFGGENDKEWTQCLRGRGGESQKIKFYNPIRQNVKHIETLKKCMNLPMTIPIYSMIVFSDHCDLKKINLTSPNHNIMKADQATAFVNYIFSQHGNTLTVEQIDAFERSLLQYCNVSNEVRMKHIQGINNRINS